MPDQGVDQQLAALEALQYWLSWHRELPRIEWRIPTSSLGIVEVHGRIEGRDVVAVATAYLAALGVKHGPAVMPGFERFAPMRELLWYQALFVECGTWLGVSLTAVVPDRYDLPDSPLFTPANSLATATSTTAAAAAAAPVEGGGSR